MGTPKVRRMVMFKHGVAYIERAGEADGPFELAFKRDEMNDVLKSLALWVAEGEAKVGAVAFEKPEDPEEALVRRKLAFPSGGTLHALLASMRGRKIAVVVDGTRLEGEVLGVETTPDREGAERRTLLLRDGGGTGGAVSLIDVGRVTKFELLEESARADLAFFVDRSRAASTGENRIVRVDVTGACRDMRVSYVVPAPTWRVSYRIAREGETTTLMAWGIVHNPVEEDLDDLALVLTTGQPVSFVIDLYNPKSVTRAVVEEESRATQAPTRFERAPMAARASFGGPPAPRAAMPMAMAPMPAPMMALADSFEEEEHTSVGASMMSASDGAASFGDKGEFFEYRVGPRISLKRGGSAMVPLLGVKLEAKKERIWRKGSPPAPDLVLSFVNTTGAVLEEGAAVVYDGDVYAGESMVPYSARGTDVLLSFAKDLAVRCRHAERSVTETHALRLLRECLRIELRSEWRHTFVAESDHSEPIDVTFELPVNAPRRFVPSSPKPFASTASFHRFKVTVPAHGTAELVVAEEELTFTRGEYARLEAAQIEQWLAARLLEVSHATAMKEALALFSDWRTLDQKRRSVEGERQKLYEKQRRINEQLAVLKDGGPEAQLRLRYVRELEEAQDALAAADATEKRLQKESEEASMAAWRKIAASAPA
jgi:hypothetical protein